VHLLLASCSTCCYRRHLSDGGPSVINLLPPLLSDGEPSDIHLFRAIFNRRLTACYPPVIDANNRRRFNRLRLFLLEIAGFPTTAVALDFAANTAGKQQKLGSIPSEDQ
jgi:hypothetical protein